MGGMGKSELAIEYAYRRIETGSVDFAVFLVRQAIRRSGMAFPIWPPTLESTDGSTKSKWYSLIAFNFGKRLSRTVANHSRQRRAARRYRDNNATLSAMVRF